MGIFSKIFGRKKSLVENSFIKIPIFNEVLVFPLPDAWSVEPSLRSLEGGTFLVEFEAEDNADEKLSVQGFNNANADVELSAKKLMKMMEDEMRGLNEAQFYSETLFSETHITQQKLITIMGLKALPDETDKAQFALYMVLEGKKEIYIVQRSWKGKTNSEGFLVPKEELLLWLEDFKQIHLEALETA